MNRFLASFAVGSVVVVSLASLAHAAPDSMTTDEYKLYREYQAALEDARVQKLPEGKRLPAIAQNFKVKPAELQAAVTKGEQFGAAIVKESEQALRDALAKTPLATRIDNVEIVDLGGHIVTYIGWKNEDGKRLSREACYAAATAVESAPISRTLGLYATDAKDARKVFEAKIGASAAKRIPKNRIEDYADTRFIRLFEDVKNAYAGGALTGSGRPTIAPTDG